MPGLFDDTGFSLLKEPVAYGPTGSAPTDTTQSVAAPMTAAAPQAQAPQQGQNWLTGLGHILSATAAGAQGDPYYVQRVQAAQQNQQMEQKKLAMEQQQMDLQHIKAIGEGVNLATTIQDTVPEGPARDTLLKSLQASYKNLGIDVPFADMAAGSSEGLKTFQAMHQLVTALPPDQQAAIYRIYKKSPAAAQESLGNFAMQLGEQHAQQGEEVPAVVTNALNSDQRKRLDETVADATLKNIATLAQQNPQIKQMNNAELYAANKNFGKLDDNRIDVLRQMGFNNLDTKETKAQTKTQEHEAFLQGQQTRGQQFGIEQQGRQMAATAANLQTSINAANERATQRDQQAEARRAQPTPQQTARIISDKSAIKTIDAYAADYNDFLKSTNGNLSAVMKGSLAKNQGAQTITDVVGIHGSTPAEQKLSASYNALVGNLKQLTNEVGVLTDQDALRILGSFNPTRTPDQVKANLQARRLSHQRSIDTTLEALQASGKDVSGFRAAPAKNDPLGLR